MRGKLVSQPFVMLVGPQEAECQSKCGHVARTTWDRRSKLSGRYRTPELGRYATRKGRGVKLAFFPPRIPLKVSSCYTPVFATAVFGCNRHVNKVVLNETNNTEV